jgi:cell division protein FtsN
MPSDYKGRSNGRDKKPMPGFLWFLAGLALGLFATLIVYLSKQPVKDTNFSTAVQHEINKLRTTPDSSAEKKTVAKKPDDNKTKKPKFNFYTILPELEVLIPDSETTMPGKNKSHSDTSTSTTTANKQYILQAGSVRNQSDAEKFKARLALLGFEANIQSVSVNGEDWYRVRVGPFNSTREMYRNLDALHKHDIDAMAMELK